MVRIVFTILRRLSYKRQPLFVSNFLWWRFEGIQSSNYIDIVNNLIHHTPGTGLRFQGCTYFKCIDNEVHNCSRRSAIGTHGLVVYTLTSKNEEEDDTVLIANNIIHDNYNELFSWSPFKDKVTPHLYKGIYFYRISKEDGQLIANGKVVKE